MKKFLLIAILAAFALSLVAQPPRYRHHRYGPPPPPPRHWRYHRHHMPPPPPPRHWRHHPPRPYGPRYHRGYYRPRYRRW